MMEHQIQYAVTCAMKLQRERLKSIEPKIEAIADFEKVMQVSPIQGIRVYCELLTSLEPRITSKRRVS